MITEEPNIVTKKSILIVDDEPLNIFLLQQILKHYDFDLSTAVDGQDALNKFNNKKFDLVLMDLYMPVMDGFEASKTMKQIAPHIPIIVISAAIVTEETLKNDLGIDHFMPKPINIEAFKNLIQTILLAN